MTTTPTVLLFDVDGTLITTGGCGRTAILRALQKAGISTATSFSFAGMTDRAIVRRFLVGADMEPSEALIDRVLDGYLEVLSEVVAAATAENYYLHEGILAALDGAEATPQLALGLGTGNIERGARVKLARVGVDVRFSFGGFGSDSEDRAALIATGAARGADELGVAVDRCRVLVVGDTPLDIAAAEANGFACLAVATGTYDLEALASHQPTHAFESLAAPGALQALLGARC